MRQIATIDAETDPFIHGREPKPFIWGFYDGTNQQFFSDTAGLVNHITGLNYYIYAHNGGKFDFHFLLPYVENSNIICINGRIVQMRLGKAILRDSFAILPIALKDYQKDEIDYGKFEANIRHKYIEEIKQYLAGDCRYLYELVLAFLQEFGNKTTAASAAFAKCKSICNIVPFKTGRYFFSMFHSFYHGGRVSIFKRGIIEKKTYIYDINSAYPWAMTMQHPFGNDCFFQSIPPENSIDENSIDEKGFYEIIGIAKGCFPYYEKGKTLSYPNDTTIRQFTVTGWELNTAIRTRTFSGHIRKSIKFNQSITFKNFIHHYYSIKQKYPKNSKEYILAKLAMNSVYGKFAANPDNYVDYVICKPEKAKYHCEKKNYIPAYITDDYALLAKELPESRKIFYNVATAASITGAIRAYLWETICQIRNKGFTVYYCDTDSVITDCPPNAFQNVDATKLGGWKMEQENDILLLHAPKIYAARSVNTLSTACGQVKSMGSGPQKSGKWKIASKGVHLTHQEIERLIAQKEVTWRNDAPTFSLKKDTSFITRTLKG